MGRVYPYASDSGEQTHEPGESITVDGVEVPSWTTVECE